MEKDPSRGLYTDAVIPPFQFCYPYMLLLLLHTLVSCDYYSNLSFA